MEIGAFGLEAELVMLYLPRQKFGIVEIASLKNNQKKTIYKK